MRMWCRCYTYTLGKVDTARIAHIMRLVVCHTVCLGAWCYHALWCVVGDAGSGHRAGGPGVGAIAGAMIAPDIFRAFFEV